MVNSRPAVRIEGTLVVPANVGDLESFRHWTLSESFPETGRIDFLDGTVEVDMSPEELQTHGQPKLALCTYLDRVISAADMGQVYVDRARLRSKKAELSCEPDVMFVSWETLQSGKAQHVTSSRSHSVRIVEIEGAVDLVVEVVSDGSVNKDTCWLPPLYAKAGVLEFWRVDARSADLKFEIFHLHSEQWQPSVNKSGFQKSNVLGRSLRLRREPGKMPHTWRYFVDEV